MKRSIFTAVLALAAIACVSASAQGLVNPKNIVNGSFVATAPRGYVDPADRVRQAGAAPTVVADNKSELKLPPGMHPNSIGAQSLREEAAKKAGSNCRKKNCVPVVGRTADGKYPVYGLQGELDDLNYISPQANIVFQPNDLYGRMGYVEPADTKTGVIKCDYICKNSAGQIVGLNPELKKFEK